MRGRYVVVGKMTTQAPPHKRVIAAAHGGEYVMLKVMAEVEMENVKNLVGGNAHRGSQRVAALHHRTQHMSSDYV